MRGGDAVPRQLERRVPGTAEPDQERDTGDDHRRRRQLAHASSPRGCSAEVPPPSERKRDPGVVRVWALGRSRSVLRMPASCAAHRPARAAAGEPDELRPLTDERHSRAAGGGRDSPRRRPYEPSPPCMGDGGGDRESRRRGAGARRAPRPRRDARRPATAATDCARRCSSSAHHHSAPIRPSALGGEPEPPFPPGGMAVVQLGD